MWHEGKTSRLSIAAALDVIDAGTERNPITLPALQKIVSQTFLLIGREYT